LSYISTTLHVYLVGRYFASQLMFLFQIKNTRRDVCCQQTATLPEFRLKISIANVILTSWSPGCVPPGIKVSRNLSFPVLFFPSACGRPLTLCALPNKLVCSLFLATSNSNDRFPNVDPNGCQYTARRSTPHRFFLGFLDSVDGHSSSARSSPPLAGIEHLACCSVFPLVGVEHLAC